jgi:hypothetical protein
VSAGFALASFPLSPQTDALVAQLAARVKTDQEESGQTVLLEAKSMAESKNWSKSIVKDDVKEVSLDHVVMQHPKTDPGPRSKLLGAVAKTDPETLYLSQSATVIQFCKGLSPIQSFVTMPEDCALLIPLHVPGDVDAFMRELGGGGVMVLPLRREPAGTQINGYVIRGSCTLMMATEASMVCVVFCLAKAN